MFGNVPEAAENDLNQMAVRRALFWFSSHKSWLNMSSKES